MSNYLRFILTILVLFSFTWVNAQQDSIQKIDYSARKAIVFSTQGVLATGSLIYLQNAWYKNHQSGKFHFNNDGDQWLGMDKVGHFATMSIVSNLNYKAYRWAGFNNNQSALIGTGLTYAYLTCVEVLDGYSNGWGFSWSDMLANTLGGALFLSQQLIWKEQRMLMKFSYHPTNYAQLRPEVLGSTDSERILKDYNGQTYWLSINPQSFSRNKKIFPKWLNIALGYSVEGVLGGTSNVGEDYDYSYYDRRRQFYFSFDVDLGRFRTRSKFVNILFDIVNILKIPAPTLEFDQNGRVNFYFFYF